MSRPHPSLDDSAFSPIQNLQQVLDNMGFSHPFCIFARLQRHSDKGSSSKGKDREGEIEWVVAVGLALDDGEREKWWSRVFTREELEVIADIPNSAVYGKELFVRLRDAWLCGGLDVRGLSGEEDLDKEIELELQIASNITPCFPLLPCASAPFSLLSILVKTIPGALDADSTSTRCEAAVAQLAILNAQVDRLRSSNDMLKERLAAGKKIGMHGSQRRKDVSPKKEGPVIPGVTKRVKITGRPGIVVKKREQEFEDPSDSD